MSKLKYGFRLMYSGIILKTIDIDRGIITTFHPYSEELRNILIKLKIEMSFLQWLKLINKCK